MKILSFKFKALLYFLVCCSIASTGLCQELAITGVYQGKPLFVQNPLSDGGNKFCVKEVTLNGISLSINYNRSALKIDFSGLDMYTPVSVKILHDSVCTPKIVNPTAIFWHSAFRYNSIAFAEELLKWNTRGERENAVYKVEKLNGNEWLELSSIPSLGNFALSSYDYTPSLTDGTNKFRVKYEAGSTYYLYSDEVEVVYYKEPITFSPRVVTDRMTLSRAVDFEILNSEEEVILKGNAKEIPLRLLKPGSYFIVLEGYKETFMKK